MPSWNEQQMLSNQDEKNALAIRLYLLLLFRGKHLEDENLLATLSAIHLLLFGGFIGS